MKKLSLIIAALGACTMAFASSCTQTSPATPVVEDKVTSVVIKNAPTSLAVGETVQLEAEVTTTGSAAKTVTWSVDKVGVASVNNGLLTALAEGSVTVTARSTVDAAVTGTATITITGEEGNWSASLLAEMTEKLGEPLPYLADGWDIEWDSDYEEFSGESEKFDSEKAGAAFEKAGYEVTVGEITLDFFGMQFVINGLEAYKYFDEYRIYVLIVDMTDEEEDPYAALQAYAEDASFTWDEEIIDEYAPKYMDYEKETVPAIEADAYFYTLGYYDVKILLRGAKTTAADYLASLEDAGWDVYDDEEAVEYFGGVGCYSPLETVLVIVSGEGNNYTVTISGNLPELDSFPSTYVNNFVKNEIKSIFSVPSTALSDYFYYDEGEGYATVYMDFAEKTYEKDAKAYYDAFIALGYEGEFTEETDEDFTSFYAQKGNIVVNLNAYTYTDTGILFALLITPAENPVTENALSIKKNDFKLLVTETAQIEASAEPGFEGEITYSSNAESIATVSTTGLITPVAEGEAEITVTLTTGEKTFTQKVSVDVVPAATSIEVKADATVKSNKTLTLDFGFLPEGSKPTTESEVSFEIVSGSEYASIDGDVLTPNAEAITEDQVVTVKATYGTLVSENFEITIQAVKAAITETVSFQGISTSNVQMKNNPVTSENGVTFTFSKANGNNEPLYYAEDDALRIYNSNTITITAPEGHTLTCLEFNETDYGKKTQASISCSNGSYSNGVWTGETSSLTLTLGSSGQLRFDSVKITLDGEPIEPTPTNEKESLMQNIITALFTTESPKLNEDYAYDEDYECYYVYAYVEDYTESEQVKMLEDITQVLAGIITIDGEITEYQEETFGGYEAYYYNEDETIEINIYTFVDDGDVGFEIDVYDAE